MARQPLTPAVAQARMCKYDGVSPPAGLGPNYGCTTAPLLELTNYKEDVVVGASTRWSPTASTNIGEGLMWGWRVLSPGAPFAQGRPSNDPHNQKVIVLMTDGENTYTRYANNHNWTCVWGLRLRREGPPRGDQFGDRHPQPDERQDPHRLHQRQGQRDHRLYDRLPAREQCRDAGTARRVRHRTRARRSPPATARRSTTPSWRSAAKSRNSASRAERRIVESVPSIRHPGRIGNRSHRLSGRNRSDYSGLLHRSLEGSRPTASTFGTVSSVIVQSAAALRRIALWRADWRQLLRPRSGPPDLDNLWTGPS